MHPEILSLNTSHYNFTFNDHFEIMMRMEGNIVSGTTFADRDFGINLGDTFITNDGYMFSSRTRC
jgi:hypothetical protein